MDIGKPSTTAMLAAVGRGRHRWFDPQPWVFDDPFALSLVGPDWPALSAMVTTVASEVVVREGTAAQAARCRYAEDRLDIDLHRQYVVLGAGLDSFAWRRPDLLASQLARGIRLFEVDHPATQVWKRERIQALALPLCDAHLFAPVDFETATLADGLSAAGFAWDQPTLFSWLGVTMYLTAEAIETTLHTVATCAAGTVIAFTYIPVPDEQDDVGRESLELLGGLAARSGEPFVSIFSASDIENIVSRCGLQVVDHPTRDELVERYFAGRADGLRPSTFERLVTAAT